jgi:hypothetical protein
MYGVLGMEENLQTISERTSFWIYILSGFKAFMVHCIVT